MMNGLLFYLQVREIDVQPDKEVENTDTIQITKLNPRCPEFKPKAQTDTLGINTPSELPKETKPTTKQTKTNKQKQTRNVALASILELGGSMIKQMEEPKMPIEPVHKSPNEIASEKKVYDWFESREKHDTRNILSTDPSTMFQEKIALDRQHNKTVEPQNTTKLVQPTPIYPKDFLSLHPSAMFKKKMPPTVMVQSNKPTTKAPQAYENYVPSVNADEYYKKYLERSKMKEIVQEDVTQGQRKVREIDEQRSVFKKHVKSCLRIQSDFATSYNISQLRERCGRVTVYTYNYFLIL